MRTASLVLAIATAAALSACGGTLGSDRPGERLTLALDGAPNGVHAGIYTAVSRGYDDADGVDVRIRRPGRRSAVRLLESGRIDAAVVTVHELARARARDADLVGVIALVQEPLTAVLAEPRIRAARDLEGEQVALRDVPGDAAVLRSVLRGAGADPGRVTATRPADPVRALRAGRVAAMVGSRHVDAVALASVRPRVLRVDERGGPVYPELVVAVQEPAARERADTIRALGRALQRGYAEAQKDPESAAGATLERAPGLDRTALLGQITAVAPSWTAGAPAFGVLQRGRLRDWAAWAAANGAVDGRVDVDRAFRFDLVGMPNGD